MIHSEIKKFWEDAGYKIIYRKRGDLVYYALKDYQGGNVIAVSSSNGIEYYLSPGNIDIPYSEEKMLRIIKLKAFL